MSEIIERRPFQFRTSLAESSLNTKLLPIVLGIIARSVDVIGFLGLGGLLAGMLGVSAMVVQNALLQISLKGALSTAVMTINIVRFIMDVGDVMFGRVPAEVAEVARPGGTQLSGDRRPRHWLRRRGNMQGGNRLRSLALPAKARFARGCEGMTANSEGGQDS
jgi:uncharacterized membrane protein YoaK (UPF0700 family)